MDRKTFTVVLAEKVHGHYWSIVIVNERGESLTSTADNLDLAFKEAFKQTARL